MKYHILYPIAGFENFSSGTLKMADFCCYGIRYGKCEWEVCLHHYSLEIYFWSISI